MALVLIICNLLPPVHVKVELATALSSELEPRGAFTGVQRVLAFVLDFF